MKTYTFVHRTNGHHANITAPSLKAAYAKLLANWGTINFTLVSVTN